jgi:RNA polymerase sigma-70 factor (ECF subfamily)
MRGSLARSQRSVADEALVRAVFQEHGRALLAYATRLVGDRQAAEDIVQETLVRAWRNPDVLVNGKGSVRGWLLRVARNLAVDWARARAARPKETEVPEVPVDTAAMADHAEPVVDSLVVLDALNELSEEHRAVLVEIYFKGSSVAEAAAALRIPPGTVRSRCYYALRSLRSSAVSRGILQEASR